MKTAFGWLVLLGALAIPAILFWKWWIAMQTTTTLEVKQKPPQEQTAFGEVKSAQENPIETAQAPLDNAPDLSPAPGSEMQEPAPESPEMDGDEPQDSTTQEPGQTAPEQRTVPDAATDIPGADGPSPTTRYAPKSSRDPMVSIFDLRELAKRRLAKELALRATKQALEPKPPPPPPVRERRPAPPPPKPYCDTVELQGIIATPNGIAAIIDDEVRHEGDLVKGATLASITTRTVIFKRRGRTVCVKRVER